ncbi:hypothetical protein [Planctellipticum variicoloris]|uniref:hypothetical protein n=1 Tax=Planctellipticum variicoloris TaxID=3064265 RepID=UPI0030135FBE|nr:hypothetical protein SH412_002788 [Planctomycetaceae bacterium SH412]
MAGTHIGSLEKALERLDVAFTQLQRIRELIVGWERKQEVSHIVTSIEHRIGEAEEEIRARIEPPFDAD